LSVNSLLLGVYSLLLSVNSLLLGVDPQVRRRGSNRCDSRIG
jgi:hypothetical protein